MYDLIGEYEETLARTRKMLDQKENEAFQLKSVIANKENPYDERAAASDQLLLIEKDKSILSSMVSDLIYAIDWMISSRRPGSRRGIERRSSAQLTRLIDPYMLQTFYSSGVNVEIENEELIENEVEKEQNIEEALASLSKREKQVFTLSRGYSLSYDKIAKELNIKKCTVQTLMKRAERKIGEYIANLEGAE